MKRAIFLLIAVLSLASCRVTRTIEKPVVVERVTHDTVTAVKTTVERDTVYFRDSIVVTDGIKEVFRDRFITRWREHTDTLKQVRTDTIPKVVTVKEVVKEKQKHAFWDALAACAVFGTGFIIALWLTMRDLKGK